ncbi:hypothetical protein P43SY_009559 [Pythium insidiosum]|uniref:Transmembrane protein n=1 Tax=Pythium insidiosum TaxID=114742 RepID=A0AAD5M3M8_PYTIN|nr:hypothetical protein P43SY_009559 [Pythium insidiosum]
MSNRLLKTVVHTVALVSGIALIVAIGLSIAAFSKVNWLTLHGRPDDQVAPNVYFEKLMVGEFRTCVTLRVYSDETNKWKSRETCYNSHLTKGQKKTAINDLVTGEKLVLAPVCDADRDWVARVLGIPLRVSVVEIWERQCGGLWWLNFLTTFFAWFGAIWLGVLMFDIPLGDPDDPACRERLSLVVTMVAVVSQAVPVLVWQYAMKVPGFEAGSSLKLALAATVILACAKKTAEGMAFATGIAVLVGIALSIAALSQENWRVADGLADEQVVSRVFFEHVRIGVQENWRVADGLADEQVVSRVFFEHVRIGVSKTCVTLRRMVNATGQWKSKETCYRTFLGREEHPTAIVDLETGQQLLLNPVCSVDREWTAAKLGIPERLDVAKVWGKQCSATEWVNPICQICAWLAACVVGYKAICLVVEDDFRPESGPVVWIVLSSIPVLLHMIPTLVWAYALTSPELDAGISLTFAIAATVIFAWAWLFIVFPNIRLGGELRGVTA